MFVTDLVYPYSFIPLVKDSDGQVMTGHAAIDAGRPPVAAPMTGQTPPLLVAWLGQDGPRLAHDPAGSSGLSAPAMPDVRAGQGRACVSWRCDEQ